MTAFSHYFWTIFKAFCELIVLLLDLTHTHTHTFTHTHSHTHTHKYRYTQFLNNQVISNPVTTMSITLVAQMVKKLPAMQET